MSPSTYFLSLIILLALNWPDATPQPNWYRPRKFSQRTNGAPSLAQAGQFVRFNPPAKALLAQVKENSSTEAANADPGCGCSQYTCRETFSLVRFVSNDADRCVIYYPLEGVGNTTCSATTLGKYCPEKSGCGCTFGACTNTGALHTPVFAVCARIRTGSYGRRVFYGAALNVHVYTACCCA